jgi:hypothetical protein
VTEPDLDPLAPELRALLASERAHPAPSAEGKARVASRLEATLFGPGGAGGAGGGGEPAPAAPPAVRPVAPLARAMRATAIFVAGGITGGVLVLALREPAVVIVERAAPTSIATPPLGAGATTAYAPQAARAPASAAPEPSSSAPAAVSSVVAAPTGVDSLAAERALLDPARTALGRGDGASALDAVHKHEARFASGKLAEEREAIAVQALVVLHRADEARARAARFQQRYPGSVLAPSVAAALETVP